MYELYCGIKRKEKKNQILQTQKDIAGFFPEVEAEIYRRNNEETAAVGGVVCLPCESHLRTDKGQK